ncbi:hypothetical protein Tsubulata_043476 [Turnera subulata]|uniref:DUF4408 domain-containing protein n=1 Tax=Turnera subulata TaxID=218843 RepID=A0A9Q0F7D4_9ROSI|nr:hypothetical protein Tsubulata_043476 [Turnera subulata]
MSKFKKSQILLLLVLAALLFVTPLLSSSSRPKYLYFIINLLIIALGAEAGLLSAFSKPVDQDKKHAVPLITKPQTPAQEASPYTEAQVTPARKETKPRAVEKSASEKIVATIKVDKVKKCPSMPSLFFIGGGDNEPEDHHVTREVHHEEEELEEAGEQSSQELFTKAETFIGNFYKQLKMQREESWKRIHGFYQKAF